MRASFSWVHLKPRPLRFSAGAGAGKAAELRVGVKPKMAIQEFGSITLMLPGFESNRKILFLGGAHGHFFRAVWERNCHGGAALILLVLPGFSISKEQQLNFTVAIDMSVHLPRAGVSDTTGVTIEANGIDAQALSAAIKVQTNRVVLRDKPGL